MNSKKILFLFLALLLPVVVFLFLKGFGKNEFNVPPMFQDVIESPEDCTSFEYITPYIISDSIMSRLSWSKHDSLTLIVFNDTSEEASNKKLVQIDRLRVEFPTEKLNVVTSTEVMFKSCIFLLKATDNAVMMDSKRRIRGQYNLTDLDEADRLIMEVKIILKEY